MNVVTMDGREKDLPLFKITKLLFGRIKPSLCDFRTLVL